MKKNYLLLVGIGALLAMSSCSQDEDLTVVKKGAPATLTLTLKGTDVNTRAVGSLPTAENTVQRVTVGLFKTNNGATDVISEGSLDQDGKITVKGSIATGDNGVRDIVVVANAPNKHFAGITSKVKFLERELSLTQTADNLPMAGISTATVQLLPNKTVDGGTVEITRLVARVQLAALTTAFDPNGQYANATFKATKVFMYNAMSKSYVDGTLTSTPWQGLTAGTDYNEYLGDVLDLSFPSLTPLYSPYNYFYTFANPLPATQTDPQLASATRLVIQGVFDPDGTLGTLPESTVYYPIIVNRDVEEPINVSGITRNNIYSITAIIKNKGGDTPITIIDPASLSLKVIVTPWPLEPISQEVTF